MECLRRAFAIGHLLAGGEHLLIGFLVRRHANPSRQHRDLCTVGLQPDFELRAQDPRLAFLGVHHKRLAGVGNAEKAGAATQLHMPLTATEIHGDGAVGIQCHLRLIGQGNGANFPRCRDVIRPQVINPTHRLPACTDTDHQQQTRGHRQRTGPAPERAAPRLVHGVEIALQGKSVFIGECARRSFAQFPQDLRPGIGLGMGGVGPQPLAERRLVTAVGLVMQQAQPGQRGLLLRRRRGDAFEVVHGAVPGVRGSGSRRLALQASRARIICFSTALWDKPMALAISAYLRP
ncbi:hypothetical protein D3C78_925660 [compost metagenome]